MGQSPEIPERPAGHDEEMCKRVAGDVSGKVGNEQGQGMWRPTDNIHYMVKLGSIWKSQSGSCHDSLTV